NRERRSFHKTGRLTFPRRTCVVLTKSGAALARALRTRNPKNKRPAHDRGPSIAEAQSPPDRPYYDRERRELFLGSVLVKQFKQQSSCQELILLSFQELGWPARIDDPLPPAPDQDAKQ